MASFNRIDPFVSNWTNPDDRTTLQKAVIKYHIKIHASMSTKQGGKSSWKISLDKYFYEY